MTVSYLLDTCVLSESVKRDPNPAVLAWLSRQPDESLFLSVVSIAEIHQGIVRLEDGEKKTQLSAWLQEVIHKHKDKIISIDIDVARTYGDVQGRAMSRGQTLPVLDTLIGATAVTHSLVVVTRNGEDIEPSGASVLNPWDQPGP